SLPSVPADIDQIRAVITLDDANRNFGRSAPPTAIVSDAAGNQLFEYRIEGLNSESIVIALELYRRQGSWKVRAVGQGYAGGFAAMLADQGLPQARQLADTINEEVAAGMRRSLVPPPPRNRDRARRAATPVGGASGTATGPAT